MKFRGILTLTLVFALASAAVAQSGKLKRAKQYMKDLSYTPAIVLLNQIIEKEDNPEAKIAIAECYRKVNDWENAEYWYSQVVRTPQAEPVHKLYYGEALQRNGKCDLAKDWYGQFTQAAPEDVRGQYLNKACDYENELLTKNAAIYEVKRMDFNSNVDDFSPAIFKDKVVFSSERDKGTAVKRDHTWTGNPFNELFVVDAKSNGAASDYKFTYSKASKFSSKLNTKYHDASVSFSPDYKDIFFTRNNHLNGKTGNDDEGKILLKVYSAKANGAGGWNEVTELPFNSNEYNVAHPAISPDGKKLYFASDMPGGFGGMDLYVSDMDGGKWGPPMNLGPKINTEGLEVFPYVDKNGKLYFATDGHVGLGGLDIYYMEPQENGEWSEVTNIGYPLNSKHDDFGITILEDGKFGYFTSDRPGGAGRDDIYSFRKMAIPASIYVYDASTKKPIENAVVVDSCTGVKYKTGKDGFAKFDMKMDVCCNFSAAYAGYLDNVAEGCSKEVDIVKVEIPLNMERRFALTGIVWDQPRNLPLAGATVIIKNDCGKKDTTIVTDKDGRFEMPLDRDCCYTATASMKDFMTNSGESICTKEVTKDSTFSTNVYLQPITITSAPNNNTTTTTTPYTPTGTTPDGNKTSYAPYPTKIDKYTFNPKTGIYEDKKGKPAKGKTPDGYTFENGNVVTPPDNVFPVSPTPKETGEAISYLLHIYYDFDQAYLRDEATPELDKLLRLLQNNPTYIIEIGSHTDARGSNAYNNRLSQRRAESVSRWLVKNGIDKERLVAMGYGETINVNDCKNNIPCNEQQHQMNRRTEFKVLGCKGCVDNPILSTPNEGTKIDNCVGCPF